MKQYSVTAVISVYNEEGKIQDCLESVKWADEIIVVDNTSTDKTPLIAKKYTKHVFVRPNNLMLNVNKNYGFTKATSDWIISLDADERISPELAKEIQIIVQDNPAIDGYWFPRKNMIFGKWIQHTGWYPDHVLRLFRREKGKFPEQHVHEMVTVEGVTAYCKEHMIHYNYDTVTQFLRKTILIYVPNEAEQLLQKGHKINPLDAIRFPFNEFMSRFFAREGYKDGFHGLMLSLLMSFYHFLIFAHMWEKEGFPEYKEQNMLHMVTKEGKKIGKELGYWITSEAIKDTKSFLHKTVLKVKRKLS